MKELIDKILEIYEEEHCNKKCQRQLNKICLLEDELKKVISEEGLKIYDSISYNIDMLNTIEIKDAIEFTYNFCKKLFK